MNHDGARWSASGTLAAGASQVIELAVSRPVAVSLAPQAGGSASAEYTLAPLSELAAATWLPLLSTSGAAAASAGRELPASALRITATGAACRFEVLQ